MKKLKGMLITILLIQLLNKAKADCTWGTGTKNCDVSCMFQTPPEIIASLERGWNEHDSCHADGITLELSYVTYPNSNVEANWFTAQVKVKELTFPAINIGIEPNAFNSTALKYLKKLTFPSIGVNPIRAGIFNGLESLEELHMKGASNLRVVETGVLNPLSNTLKHFSLVSSSSSWSEISINGFTGSGQLTALTNVKYEYTLKSTINRNSFAGLTNVVTLDLSYCLIETIGAGAFDPISNSVRTLNLRNNRIITLPDGIFQNILIANIATIALEDNRLECNCSLMPFKLTYIENENANFGPVTCYNPLHQRGANIVSVDFCDDYIPPTTTESATTISTTITSTTTTTSANTPTEQATTNIPTEPPSTPEEFSQICYEAVDTTVTKNVSIKTPRSGLRINENVDGHPTLEMDVAVENSVLIWFSQFDRETYRIADDDITCVISSEKAIPIIGLDEDVAYTFCLMDSVEKTVSPLDCISYRKAKAGEQAWIYQDNISLVISMGVLACFVSVLIGSVIGFFTLNHIIKKQNQTRKANGMSCINDVLKEAFQSNSIRKNRMSSTTTTSGNTKRTTNYTVDYYLEDAPPLPARPHSMHPFEEPIYAVVRN